MTCDLERVFDALAQRVATDASGNDHFVFSTSTLPTPPTRLVTDRLVITKGKHQYDSHYRADHLRWEAHKSTYRYLGLLILSIIFHETVDHVEIDL